MATIIETSNGFIAGDPPTELPVGHHWCVYCGGDGLEYTHTDDGPELGICQGCWGACTIECDDDTCIEHNADAQSKRVTEIDREIASLSAERELLGAALGRRSIEIDRQLSAKVERLDIAAINAAGTLAPK